VNLDGASLRSPARPSAQGLQVSQDPSGRTVVDLGQGNNQATVTRAQNGGLTVTSDDGSRVTLDAAQAQNAVIRGGAGNDRITVAADVHANLRIEGGQGNDTLIGGAGKNTLVGGSGDDYLQGGAGDDSLDGGLGRDVMYGLNGKDTLRGGADRDYADGGAGDDAIDGGLGNDQVLGGRDNDTLTGGAGDDVVAAGSGKDTVAGGAGRDTLYVQTDDAVTSSAEEGDTVTEVSLSSTGVLGRSLTVEGDAAFQARVQSDLEALRSIPAGRELLQAMDQSGHTTTIRQTAEGNSASATDRPNAWLKADGTPGSGSDAVINYNLERTALGSEDWQVRPPQVGFFHEMVHAYNYVTGTLAPGETDGVNNRELAAVGLPYDHDGDAATAHQHPGHHNENRLREQLGLPQRPEY
jgi:hypothetical protein